MSKHESSSADQLQRCPAKSKIQAGWSIHNLQLPPSISGNEMVIKLTCLTQFIRRDW